MHKRKMYLSILALAICMLALVLGAALWQQAEKDPLEYVRFREEVRGMTLAPTYDAGEDAWYLYLPAYADREDLRITADSGTEITLEGEKLRVDAPLRSGEYTLRIMQCTNLPTLAIDAEPGAVAYIHSNIEHEKDVYVTMADGGGETLFQQIAVISGRGNGTWLGGKRPYNLNFSDRISVGPFQDITKLSLLAEAYDESKLRNSLAYYGGREMGIPYASGYLHCNLYINGEYQGLYGISTKQEYEKHILSDGIQGVFEYTFYPKENQFFAYPLFKSFRVLYGDMGSIRYAVEDAYQAILAQDWQWCAELIDFPSFARKYILDEFFGNDDMGVASQYYYLDSQGVIHCMLPWDYDWSMGSTNRYFDLPPERDILGSRYDDYWVSSLLESPQFREEIVKAVEESFTQEWLDGLTEHMKKTIQEIGDSLECDARRWAGEKTTNTYGNMPDKAHLLTLQEQYSRYFPARRDFLRDYYRDREAYVRVGFQEERYPALYLPRGAQLKDYFGLTNIWAGANLSRNILSWRTEEGLTPQDISTVDQDITFLPVYGAEPAETPAEPAQAVSSLDQPWLKILVLCCVAAVMALLVGAELRRSAKKKEEVAV